MANKPATPRQLAYLDELKMRLNDLRERQAAFMAQTAKMLDCISSAGIIKDSDIDVTTGVVVNASAAVASPTTLAIIDKNTVGNRESANNGSKIKNLVKRFEDLRKTSEQFTDLPVPEELIGVDVRKLLKGYEKLIEDGSVLQQSWYLLKKSTESCARLNHKEDFPLSKTSSTTSKISFSPDLLHPHGHQRYLGDKSNINNISSNNTSVFGIAKRNAIRVSTKSKEPLVVNWSCSKRDYDRTDHARWRLPLLQLLMRLNPLKRCQRVKSKCQQ